MSWLQEIRDIILSTSEWNNFSLQLYNELELLLISDHIIGYYSELNINEQYLYIKKLEKDIYKYNTYNVFHNKLSIIIDNILWKYIDNEYINEKFKQELLNNNNNELTTTTTTTQNVNISDNINIIPSTPGNLSRSISTAFKDTNTSAFKNKLGFSNLNVINEDSTPLPSERKQHHRNAKSITNININTNSTLTNAANLLKSTSISAGTAVSALLDGSIHNDQKTRINMVLDASVAGISHLLTTLPNFKLDFNNSNVLNLKDEKDNKLQSGGSLALRMLLNQVMPVTLRKEMWKLQLKSITSRTAYVSAFKTSQLSTISHSDLLIVQQSEKVLNDYFRQWHEKSPDLLTSMKTVLSFFDIYRGLDSNPAGKYAIYLLIVPIVHVFQKSEVNKSVNVVIENIATLVEHLCGLLDTDKFPFTIRGASTQCSNSITTAASLTFTGSNTSKIDIRDLDIYTQMIALFLEHLYKRDNDLFKLILKWSELPVNIVSSINNTMSNDIDFCAIAVKILKPVAAESNTSRAPLNLIIMPNTDGIFSKTNDSGSPENNKYLLAPLFSQFCDFLFLRVCHIDCALFFWDQLFISNFMMFPALMVVSFIAMKDRLLICTTANDAFRVFTENGPQTLLLSNMKDLLQQHFIPKATNRSRLQEYTNEINMPEINVTAEYKLTSPKVLLSPTDKAFSTIKKNKPLSFSSYKSNKLIKFRKIAKHIGFWAMYFSLHKGDIIQRKLKQEEYKKLKIKEERDRADRLLEESSIYDEKVKKEQENTAIIEQSFKSVKNTKNEYDPIFQEYVRSALKGIEILFTKHKK